MRWIYFLSFLLEILIDVYLMLLWCFQWYSFDTFRDATSSLEFVLIRFNIVRGGPNMLHAELQGLENCICSFAILDVGL